MSIGFANGVPEIICTLQAIAALTKTPHRMRAGIILAGTGAGKSSTMNPLKTHLRLQTRGLV